MIKLNGIRNAEEAIRKAGMGYFVEQTGIMGNNGIDVPDHKLLFRSDNNLPLGVVGRDYHPIQNHESFSFFDCVCEQYGASYEFAAEIKGGKKIILQARLDKQFDVRPDDPIDEYVTLVNSHDGSTALKCFFTPVRLFCMNQLQVALRSAIGSISLRHTQHIQSRIADAMKVMNLSAQYFIEFREKAQFLARKLVDKHLVDKFLDEVLQDTGSTRNQNQRSEVVRLFENGKGNGHGTAWDLFNGLTEYVDHFRGSNESKRLESSMFGQGGILKNRAFEKAMAL